MRVETAGLTDVGRKRKHNEDALLVDDALGLYVVCDGMGGHAAGEVASRLAIDMVQRVVTDQSMILARWDGTAENGEPVVRLVRHAVEAANAEVHALSRRDKSKTGMGTTLTMMLLKGSTAVMGHVGDSRLYLVRAGTAHQLSEDHSFANEMRRRGMDPAQLGSAHANVITRAVGIQAAVQVDTLLAELLPGDKLLLCSDGLTRYVDDNGELVRALAKDTLDASAQHLVQLANDRGGADNVSVIVVGVSHEVETTGVRRRIADLSLKIETLQAIMLFRDLTLSELYKVLAIVRAESRGLGEDIVREGEAGDSLYAVLEGRCAVIRQGTSIAALRRGAHFGEMSLLSRRPRSATVRTTRPTRLLVMERARFTELVSSEPQLGLKLMWAFAMALSDRLDDVSMQLLAVGDFDEDTSPGG